MLGLLQKTGRGPKVPIYAIYWPYLESILKTGHLPKGPIYLIYWAFLECIGGTTGGLAKRLAMDGHPPSPVPKKAKEGL